MTNEDFFGQFGGSFIPEILHPVINELKVEFNKIKSDGEFWNEYSRLLSNYSTRATPLTYASRLTEHFSKAKIYIKREDLNHTGAHKFNNVIGQGLLTKRMGKERVIAETGAGQHGVATSIMAAMLGIKATIYMGAVDVERQYPNVFWMKQLGAEVVPVEHGSGTLKDAINEALRDWVSNFDTTHYVLGTACGPAPFPEMVTHFQSIIGKELKEQILKSEGRFPNKIYACVGGGSNAIGIFNDFIEEKEVELIGVEAGGRGPNSEQHASRIAYKKGKVGIAQGYKTIFLQNDDGQMLKTHSIAAGLDYVGVSPILADLFNENRVKFSASTDDDVIKAFTLLVKLEGIIPALESTHAFAKAFEEIDKTNKDDIIVINLSGRGDKDIFNIAEALFDKEWIEFIKRRSLQYESN
ncbi:tryptophan synthase subunit beta [Evansella sp. AB-P1]|uniref:tryptophan synthase subunit beta n=1 Tax=Evansella sp. AB-P1 TaxID=3037653 RepID=UPI00241CCD0B|nr:tryptophan synthase subunit beta [Evansella sp. AB-P1]MDG5788618.1 tryptophan synthase subunit beta [Evansella sp. AB-P1]